MSALPPISIALERVSKRFDVGGQQVQAVADIEFQVRRGEFVSLIGPSGCGKSTVLRMLADLAQPSTGRVTIEGGLPSEARRRRLLGMVFQDATLLPWRTTAANIELPLEVVNRERVEAARPTEDLLKLVGLQDFRNALPAQLSGGMRQRAAIARALILNPKVLLLDEPFGALDEITRNRLNFDLLKIWTEVGITAVLVTHSIAEAVTMSDRIYVMSPRPARIVDVIDVALPRPRNAEMTRSPAFFEFVARTSEALYRPFEVASVA